MVKLFHSGTVHAMVERFIITVFIACLFLDPALVFWLVGTIKFWPRFLLERKIHYAVSLLRRKLVFLG